MKKIIQKILFPFRLIWLSPHILFLFCSNNREIIVLDLLRWADVHSITHKKSKLFIISVFVEIMKKEPQYRNLFYYRIGWCSKILSPLYKPMSTLYICTQNIGAGLYIHHGFSTIIAAKSIGRNCWINQQVTIGYSETSGQPEIGDNVAILPGAKVFGGIKIGNNSVVGANSVIVKNVPENCTVVGAPAFIIKRNGIKCKEYL